LQIDSLDLRQRFIHLQEEKAGSRGLLRAASLSIGSYTSKKLNLGPIGDKALADDVAFLS